MSKRNYITPEIRRVQLEDKRIVAMATCNHLIGVDGAYVAADEVVDKFGNILLNYDPSL